MKMSKLIQAPGKWKRIVSGHCTRDEDANFAYLGGIEELVPEASPRKRNLGQKKNSKRKRQRPSPDFQTAASKESALNKSLSCNENWIKAKSEKTAKQKKRRKCQTIHGNNETVHVTDETECASEPEASIGVVNEWTELGVPSEISRALSELNFTSPTPIQQLVLPSAIRDRFDIVGAAQTGSGKTLAFGIPIVARILSDDFSKSTIRGLRALILTPTRELAVQIRNHICAIIKHASIKIMVIVGGLSQQKQERIIKSRPDILVATPGRLWALMTNSENDSYLGDLSHLQSVVVDEMDRMVEKGHFDELSHIMNRVKTQASVKRQTMIFSATLTYVHPPPRRLGADRPQTMTRQEKIDELADIAGLRDEYKVIDLTRKSGTAETLVETRLNCENLTHKDSNLYYLLKRHPGRTLIFTNSIDAARRLHGLLTKLRLNPLPTVLHARMHQKQRLKNLERFAAIPNSVLLATDVAARGLDIRHIEHVIHYQVPKTAELYVHRSGRTGRASGQGLTVLLVDPQDAAFYRRICRNLHRETDLPLFPIDSPALFECLKRRVTVATELESAEYRIRKITSRENWFQRSAKQAEIDLDEREVENRLANEQVVELGRTRKALMKRLAANLAQPLPRIDLVQTRYPSCEMAANYDKTMASAIQMVDKSLRRQYRQMADGSSSKARLGATKSKKSRR